MITLDYRQGCFSSTGHYKFQANVSKERKTTSNKKNTF